MRRILKFVRLPSIEQRVLLKSAFLLVAVRLSLFFFPFKTLLNRIERVKSESRRADNHNGMSSDRIAWAVVVASRYIPFTKCLSRALVAHMLFARYGYTAQLRIGVVKSDTNELEAHAWVESEGRIMLGNSKDLSRFSLLPSLEREKT